MGPRFFKRGEDRIVAHCPGKELASMGPRFFKRGEHVSDKEGRLDVHRFNGATLLQAWRGVHASQTDNVSRGFNGATLLQAWRAELLTEFVVRSGQASMGPRFFKRGEHITR